MCEVLGLDTVVAVNLGGVEQAAETESVQSDREDVPVVTPDTVQREHGHSSPRHCRLYEEPAGDVEVARLLDGEEAAEQGPQGGGQAQPELEQGQVGSHQSLPLLPLVVDLQKK